MPSIPNQPGGINAAIRQSYGSIVRTGQSVASGKPVAGAAGFSVENSAISSSANKSAQTQNLQAQQVKPLLKNEGPSVTVQISLQGKALADAVSAATTALTATESQPKVAEESPKPASGNQSIGNVDVATASTSLVMTKSSVEAGISSLSINNQLMSSAYRYLMRG